jgi:hypothetical protein
MRKTKTTDYGGAGLNRGYSFHFKKPRPIGVVFIEDINSYLVRIVKNGKPCTVAKFEKKEDADCFYKSLLKTE